MVGCATLSGSSCGHAFLHSRGKLIDLGTLPGGVDSNATAINEHGQVVGVSGLTDINFGLPFGHAFRYSDGQMTDLGTLGGNTSRGVQDIRAATWSVRPT